MRKHWQWWIIPDEGEAIKVLAIPERFYREMLADWRGASMAQGHGPCVLQWYSKNHHKMLLHEEAKRWIETEIGYREPS